MTPSTRATAGQDTVASLRARLARLEREAAARERQLEAYAADLREVFKQERARAQELRRSYMATVRAPRPRWPARAPSPCRSVAAPARGRAPA